MLIIQRSMSGPSRSDDWSRLAGCALILAALYRGDVELPRGSDCYALFRDRSTQNLAAIDLMAC